MLFVAAGFDSASPTPTPPAPVDIYVRAAGDDSNPGTELLPLATLGAAVTLIPFEVSAQYRVHLRAETYPLPGGDGIGQLFLGPRVFDGGSITFFADESWDPTVYTNVLTAVAGGGTTAEVIVAAGLVVNAYQGLSVRFTSGAASGQYRRINSNSAVAVNVNAAFAPAPAAGDTYEIFSLVTKLAAPALSDNDGYTIVNGCFATPPVFPVDLLERSGVIWRGVIFDGASTTFKFSESTLFYDGCDVIADIAMVHTLCAVLSGFGVDALRGWGLRAVGNAYVGLQQASAFRGAYHGTEGFTVANSDVQWTSGHIGRLLNCLFAGATVFVGTDFVSPVVPVVDPGGGSIAIDVVSAGVVLELFEANVQGGGAGIRMSAGSTLMLHAAVTGASTAGLALQVQGGSRAVCIGAPAFGGAGNDWQVRGAPAFNKAALAVVGSAVVGTDGSVATRVS